MRTRRGTAIATAASPHQLQRLSSPVPLADVQSLAAQLRHIVPRGGSMKIVSALARALAYGIMLITAIVAATSRGLAVQDDQDDTARRRGGSYSVRNLVSDGFVPAHDTDPQLGPDERKSQ
jgi:hypothetical protein